MPIAAPKPCCEPGCHALVSDGTQRCVQHKTRRGTFGDRARGSRHERGYGVAWDRLRQRVLTRDSGICQHCLKASGAVHLGREVDHIVPKARGGTDDESNLQTICGAAHRAKTQREAAAGAHGHGTPGGHQISGATAHGTDLAAKFLCAQVSEIFS